ncbi:SigE family RNA polymerase sigma factor [Geodermatophilus sp. FMUSA9-8]|uniref:SigE family RNA polymerase sigma factor n=1 Tax=Geodermatophilus sp. FMUSA9-8 TaxID=3120155 RepID=UPI0030083FA0
MLRLATLLAGDSGHGEDLMQTALLKLYRRWARVSRLEHPAAYARRVLVTTHTSWRRRLSTSEQIMESLPDRAAPDRAGEVDHDLRMALQTLPPRMRAALVLRYFADLTEEQTAQVMGCTTSTVDTQVVRRDRNASRRRLSARLANWRRADVFQSGVAIRLVLWCRLHRSTPPTLCAGFTSSSPGPGRCSTCCWAPSTGPSPP